MLAVIDRVYGFRSKVSQAERELGSVQRGGALVQLVELRSNDELANTNDEHVIAAVDYLLNYAYEQRASDIHLEPRHDDAVIRFRIDGILHDIETLPISVHGAVTSRIKVLAGMNIAERRRPQDGRIKTRRADREVELRVSSHGDRLRREDRGADLRSRACCWPISRSSASTTTSASATRSGSPARTA